MAPHPPARAAVDGRESSRKALHIAASLAAAGIAWQLPTAASRGLFAGAVLIALAVELVRHLSPAARFFDRAFGPMLRTRESRGLTGATTLAIGFAIAALLPRPFGGAGILAAGLGDAAGALVGRRFGRRRTRSGKSLEGSLACFAAAFVAAWASPGLGPGPAIVVALVTTLLEALPLPSDDNLILPPASAAAAWLAAAISG